VKILYIIRDPLQRALSQLRMNVSRRTVEPDVETLLRMSDEWDIDNRGDYLSHIPHWRSALPPGGFSARSGSREVSAALARSFDHWR